jgi:hypothetical protein
MLNCPLFFSSYLEGAAQEVNNVVLSFAAPVISQDQQTRQYLTNVRVVMSKSSVKEMVDFLNNYLLSTEQQQAYIHNPPENKQ